MNRLAVQGELVSLPPRFGGIHGSVAQLDRASHYGCEGLGFESLQGHEEAWLPLATGLFCSPLFALFLSLLGEDFSLVFIRLRVFTPVDLLYIK